MSAVGRALRRALRPLVPWRARDRIRSRRLLRQVRHNVDVIVPGRLRAVRWLATAPPTYRAGRPSSSTTAAPTVAVPEGDPHGLAGLVTDDAPVAVAAHAAPPRWRRRGEPARLEPLALVATAEAMADIAGTGDDAVPALVDRFAHAGHRLRVVPEGREPRGPERLDAFDEPAAVVLAAVPLHDVGGGSRGAQLAMELLRRGFRVAYVARFATWGDDAGLRHIHPRLEQYPQPRFDPAAFAARARSPERVAVCEVPVAEYAVAAPALAGHGFHIVYDLVDDWSDPALGLDWYRPGPERELVAAADAVVASAVPLVERVRAMGAEPTLVPNGVNEAIFTGDIGPRPPDLPDASPLLGYHGSLYGNWFDWDALAAVAETWPDGAVVVIGEARDAPPLPSNVRLVGPRAQFQLPPYVGRYDVGLVPFRLSPTTHAVSPLKAFECLAMGVPVAAPPLRALEGLAGVHLDGALTEAVRAALAASRPDGAAARRAHGWGERLGRLLEAAGMDLPPPADPPVRPVVRPFVTYRGTQRLLRGSGGRRA